MDKFPREILDVPQWAVCGFHPGTSAEKQPYVWDNIAGDMVPLRKDGTQYHKPNMHLLMSSDDAIRCIKHYNTLGHNLMVGFYLLPSDPFCCIDMDIKLEWSDIEKQAAGARYQKIVEAFHSYTEISRSGNGLHTWIHALPQEGKRRDGVELYSQYRYIICTGKHWAITPTALAGALGHESEFYIADLVQKLRSEMGDSTSLENFKMVELTEEQHDSDPYAVSDVDIYTRGAEASNGHLFKQLWDGRWQVGELIGEERPFQSQSEAEFALIDMLCFYTKYNFQVRRLFMRSALSSRYDERRQSHEKVKRPYHLEQMIKKRRKDEVSQMLEVQQIQESNVARSIANIAKQHEATTPVRPPSEFLATDGQFNVEAHGGLEWPPGFMGELARYMFSISLRPVKDISILSALALMSGICGKAWNTHTNGGLNNFFILVARSGIGKDAFRTNMSRVLQQVEERGGKDGTQLFGARGFLDTSRYASEPALLKAVINEDGAIGKLSFVHYMDEIGSLISDMAMGKGKAPDLAHAMLTLYGSSNFHAQADGLKYSNKENNHSGGRLAAYSLAGETTPTAFYSDITDRMLGDGFMSRLIIWDCEVPRPLENKNSNVLMPDSLLSSVGQLITQATILHAGTDACYVKLDAKAEQMYDRLDLDVNELLNGKNGDIEQDEVVRQAHNRRAFKILRIACLLAVGDNCFNPVVNEKHFQWASDFINTSNDRIISKHKGGEVGGSGINSDKVVLNKVQSLINGKSRGRDQKTYPMLAANFVVTLSDIRVNTINSPVFKNCRDPKDAFSKCIQSIIDMGAMRRMSANELSMEPFVVGDGRPYRGAAFLVDLQRVEEQLENM